MLAFAVYLLRRRLAGTAAFEGLAKDRPPSGAGALWKARPRSFVLVAVISAGGSLSFYAYTTYMQKFLANTAGFPIQTATGIMTAALIVFMLAQPVFGALADRVGRKPMLLLFGIGGMLVSVPVFTALEHVATPVAAFGIVLVPLLLLAAYTSISALIKAELFPAHIRALGVSLPYAIGNASFGGTAEYGRAPLQAGTRRERLLLVCRGRARGDDRVLLAGSPKRSGRASSSRIEEHCRGPRRFTPEIRGLPNGTDRADPIATAI